MPPIQIRQMGLAGPEIQETSKARTILKHAHEAAEGFIKSFADVRSHRGAGQGATKDEEQDLLRASVVFAAAGLDSTLKQVIRDGLASLAQRDTSVGDGLENFVRRQLKGESDSTEAASGQKFLAKVLVSPSARGELIEQYILSLTGSSLQSVEELFKVAAALGIDAKKVGISNALRDIFNIRNDIIHELDINLAAPNRNRESRKRADMVKHSNTLLEIGESMIRAIETKLS